MDEVEYRRVYHSVNARRCVFEKAVLTRRFHCRHLRRMNIGEREAAGCGDGPACVRCRELLVALRRKAAFALHQPTTGAPLPHAREIRVQCGGLTGIGHSLGSDGPDPTRDIAAALDGAERRWGRLEDLPWDEIVRDITAYRGRRRRR